MKPSKGFVQDDIWYIYIGYIWPACSGIVWTFSSRLLGESVLQSSVSLLKFRTRLFVASHVLVEQLDVECPLKGLCVR